MNAKLAEIAVIVPVYSGHAQVKACIESLLLGRGQHPYRILVVYDCGPDPRVEAFVRRCAASGRLQLIVNQKNLGFTRSVNQALVVSDPDDVVVLNSDTVVPKNWLDILVASAAVNPNIATVTPLSNNAEICSFPRICCNNRLPAAYTVALVNQLLTEVEAPPPCMELPTGVGFCMFIRRRAIRTVGIFDAEAFGRGYGEENDFCQRLIRQGLRNAVCPRLWVYHEGNVSFGAEKRALAEKHLRVLEARHPTYLAQVRHFISSDPLKAYRLRAVLKLLSNAAMPTILMCSHGLGGGTAKCVGELSAFYGDRVNVCRLEPRDARTLALTLPSWAWPQPLLFDIQLHLDLLFECLSCIAPAAIHIHHIKGLEQFVDALVRRCGSPFIITLHDFYWIASNPTLTDRDGIFDAGRAWRQEYLEEDLDNGAKLTFADWNHLIWNLFTRASLIVAPSQSVRDIYRRRFPDLPITVAAHLDAELCGHYPPVSVNAARGGGHLSIAVLGALSREKGADVLEAVAIIARQQQLSMDFKLIGYAYRPLHAAVTTTGPYDDSELKRQLESVKPDFIWFPATCSESYSYTLSAVLELGLPVIVPALGALPERIEGRPFSRVVQAGLNPEQWLQQLLAFGSELASSAGQRAPWTNQRPAGAFYRQRYFEMIARAMRPEPMPLPELAALQSLMSSTFSPPARWRQQLIWLLLRMREWPGGRTLSRRIPLSVQRSIKRRLMRQPVHEVAR